MSAKDALSQLTPSAQTDGSPVFRAIRRIAGRPVNAFVVQFAGSRYLQGYGVVHHRGRRSGRAYTTPVIVRPVGHGFVIPLAFGERADWLQNLRAAGGCVIRWNGQAHSVVDPVIIDWLVARPTFAPLQRTIATLLGIKRCVHVRYGAATPGAGTAAPRAGEHAMAGDFE
jgi:deazaflavin-dependent oxidoreductase (nitroreductase family)